MKSSPKIIYYILAFCREKKVAKGMSLLSLKLIQLGMEFKREKKLITQACKHMYNKKCK